MLGFFKNILDKKTDSLPDAKDLTKVDRDCQKLASAVILVEVALMDSRLESSEQERLIQIFQKHLECTPTEAAQLLQTAHSEAEHRNRFYSYAKTIKDTMEYEQRVQLIELLWEVAFADGHLDEYEDNLIRRAAGLLYVTDRDRAEARQRATKRLGIGG